MAMVSESFLQRIQIKKKNSGGGRIAWVIEIFYKESEMLKKGKIIFLFSVLGRGGGEGKCFVFFLQRIEIYTFFMAEGGMEGVVWRGGSVARVDVNSFYK